MKPFASFDSPPVLYLVPKLCLGTSGNSDDAVLKQRCCMLRSQSEIGIEMRRYRHCLSFDSPAVLRIFFQQFSCGCRHHRLELLVSLSCMTGLLACAAEKNAWKYCASFTPMRRSIPCSISRGPCRPLSNRERSIPPLSSVFRSSNKNIGHTFPFFLLRFSHSTSRHTMC